MRRTSTALLAFALILLLVGGEWSLIRAARRAYARARGCLAASACAAFRTPANHSSSPSRVLASSPLPSLPQRPWPRAP